MCFKSIIFIFLISLSLCACQHYAPKSRIDDGHPAQRPGLLTGETGAFAFQLLKAEKSNSCD